MTDEVTTPLVEGEAPAAADTTPPPTGAEPTPPVVETETPPPAAEPAEPQPWADDWRERMAGGDDKTLKRLQRYASPEEAAKGLMTAEGALRQREAIDWDEDAGKLRKKLGVPETIEEYDVKYPYDNLPDEDKATVDQFKTAMYEANLTPKQAQSIMDLYADHQKKTEQDLQQAAADLQRENIKALEKEWGVDYKRNIEIAKTFLDQHAGGPAGREELADMIMLDGTKLGNHPAFLKFITAAGMATLDDDAMITSETTGRGVDVNARIQELYNMRDKDPGAYGKPEVQDELRRLVELRERRAAAGRG